MTNGFAIRNTFDGEDILKSNKFDLNIIGPYNFAQSITGQLLLRTTPPTIQYKEKLLRINYKIRVHVFGDSKKSPICTVEQSIVVGTWPRADIPIDDDDDEDIIHQMGEVMISDENDDDDGFYYSEIDTKRNSTLSVSPSTINGYTITSPVKRKGSAGSHTSNHSLNSSTSWRSSVSTEPRVNTNLQDPFHRNTHPSMMSFNGYLNRSSSTPDLLANSPVSPTPQLQSRTPVMNPHRTSYYDHTSGHRSTNSIHMSPIHTSFGFSPVEQQHRRVGSDEFNFYAGNIPNYTVPPAPQDPDVPNHTLQPLSSSEPVEMPSPTTPLSQLTPPPPYTPVQLQPHVLEPVNTQMGTLVSESEDDDSDDDDLFAIIEKKKKREERELRRKQRTMYSVPE